MRRKTRRTRQLLLVAIVAALAACSGTDGGTGAPGAEGAEGKAGPAGPKGPAGPAGPSGDAQVPSISAVSPSRAFLGRKLDVTISAVGTSWSGTPVVDFGGAGVRVDRVQLASPTALVASIDVEATATPGIRDIRVSDSTSQTEYKGVFAVEPPLSVMVRGTQAQGSIVSLRVVNRDLSTPFDSSGESEGYPNLVLAPMPGVTTNLGSVSPFSLTATLLIDSDAAAGPRELKLTSGPIGDSHTFPVTTMLSVAARTPTVLSTATLTRGNVTTPYGSMLYALTAPAGLALIDTTVSNTSSAVSPQLYLLDEMGKWSEFEPLSGALLGNGARAFLLVAWDETGAPAYEFEVQTVVTPATGAVEASGNDTSAGAQVAVSLPFVLQGAGLSSATDQDWVRITVSADDVGKSLHVLTNAGPDGSETTDTLLRVFAADGTTVLATSSDYGFHDDLVTDPIEAAGTYYVVISASEVATPADDGYEAWIRME